MSFAVIKTGGKQYKVALGDKLLVEKLKTGEGQEVVFDEVLLAANGDPTKLKIGQPLIEGAKVKAKVLEQTRDKKKIVFKYTNKTRYKKKKGHRQPLTRIEITEISA